MTGVAVSENMLKKILDVFPIDTDRTFRLDVEGLAENARSFWVDMDLPVGEAYIVDTVPGAELASMPEIVGRRMEERARAAAREAAKLFKKLVGDNSILFLHILRASGGYQLDTVLEERFSVENIYVRVKYDEGSYRSHDEREARAIYTKVGRLLKKKYLLVVSDTVATGRSMVEAMQRALKVVEFKGVEVVGAVIYGFLSLAGIRRVSEFLSKNSIDNVFFIALQDIAPLASNMYDMPLYGLDEHAYTSRGEKVRLGAIVDGLTFRRMAPLYYPGMDQPGDWSERQCMLYTGVVYERGEIDKHLRKSLELLERLREIQSGEDWYAEEHDQIYLMRRRAIEKALEEKKYC